ncbi:MAG: sporulation protein YabP [Clostridiales bacterium]|nr:sporulation protein YabP [Clostridiales bacterium]MBP3941033.1 sporulation protein YabP [Christensenellaceae bacterium]
MTEVLTNEFKGHRVTIEAKRKITVTAVEDIDSFNENEIIFLTTAGMMTVSGQDLHINRLSLEEGILSIDGEIFAIDYADLEEQRTQKSGFFSRVFK